MRIALVSCGKQKLQFPAPARDLYCSTLFRKTRAYVEPRYDRWFVLSALHLVLLPEEFVEPYDVQMPASRQLQLAWGEQAASKLAGLIPEGCEIDCFAGASYTSIGGVLLRHGQIVKFPLKGLQIGERLQWLTRQNAVHPAAMDGKSRKNS